MRPQRTLKNSGLASTEVEYTALPQTLQNANNRLLPLSAIFTYVLTGPLRRRFSAFTGTLTRYGAEEKV